MPYKSWLFRLFHGLESHGLAHAWQLVLHSCLDNDPVQVAEPKLRACSQHLYRFEKIKALWFGKLRRTDRNNPFPFCHPPLFLPVHQTLLRTSTKQNKTAATPLRAACCWIDGISGHTPQRWTGVWEEPSGQWLSLEGRGGCRPQGPAPWQTGQGLHSPLRAPEVSPGPLQHPGFGEWHGLSFNPAQMAWFCHSETLSARRGRLRASAAAKFNTGGAKFNTEV